MEVVQGHEENLDANESLELNNNLFRMTYVMKNTGEDQIVELPEGKETSLD